MKELPPRARRILTLTLKNPLPGGTTSACAENTPLTPAEVATGGNYLRVRGEYGRVVKTSDAFSELPPRARRIHTIAEWAASDNGTTSACAENTPVGPHPRPRRRNYLRVRGEYPQNCYETTGFEELPPRARRIQVGDNQPITVLGTTSACAENTASAHYQVETDGNYLRVRGEYPAPFLTPQAHPELPPRARRIPPTGGIRDERLGTTSACAENTHTRNDRSWVPQNYLRVRGEYACLRIAEMTLPELPPRARRIHQQSDLTAGLIGTTSACAENTLNELGLL